MLIKRIIPCLDIKDGRVVKGIKFLGLKDAGDPVGVARLYDEQQADEIVFLDIIASYQNRKILINLVEKIAQNIFIPFTVGGGIQDINDIKDILHAGAEKVSLNTQAVKYPDLVKQASDKFGSQCIVVAIDAKLVQSSDLRIQKEKLNTQYSILNTPKWQVYINGGRTPTELDVVDWAKRVRELGAGEILLTSMDCDGTKGGFDIELTKAVTRAVSIPVIASGGAGKPEHFYEVFKEADADAGLAASIFHYQEYSIKQVKKYLKEKGIPVRL